MRAVEKRNETALRLVLEKSAVPNFVGVGGESDCLCRWLGVRKITPLSTCWKHRAASADFTAVWAISSWL